MIVILTDNDLKDKSKEISLISLSDIGLRHLGQHFKKDIIEKSHLIICQVGNQFKILKIRYYVSWAKTNSVHHTQDLGRLLYAISLLE